MSVTNIPLAISNLTLGIGAAFVLGGVILFVKYGRQCRDNIAWIMEMCKNARGAERPDEAQQPDADSSVDELSKVEIDEIQGEISNRSRQVKAILVEIKKMRDAELPNALEGDSNLVLTEYAMKWEVRRVEFEKAIRAMEAAIHRMPGQAVAYRQDTVAWIARARNKLEKCSPEELLRRVKAAKDG